MMRKFINVFVIFTVVLFLNSCLTIARGTHQKIEITSEPSGAKVSKDGIPLGETPMIIKLKRSLHHNLIIDKEGFKSVGVFIKSVSNNTLEALVGVTAVFTLFLGLIDIPSGATSDLIPPSLHIVLQSGNTIDKNDSSVLDKREKN